MRCSLKIRIFQIMLLVSVIFFAASVAQAGSLHHHHADAVSPFDKIHKDKPLHCILNLHEHFQNKPCPHKGRDWKNVDQVLRADCGSSPDTANFSSSSFAKNLFENAAHDDFMPLQFSSKIKIFFSYKSQHLPRSIDHPPQLV